MFRSSRLPLVLSALAMFLALAGVTPSGAQGVTNPEYFKVTNVAADDVLNVRMAPDASSQILGSLRPDAFPVEVFERQGDWGRIVFQEANGWVSMNFLSPLALPVVPGTRLPSGLVCGGVEPFWSVEVVGTDKLAFESLAGNIGITFNVTESGGFEGRPNADFIWARDNGNDAATVIRREICSDGASDRDYPMSIDFLIRGGGSASALDGCCSVPVFEK